MDFFKNAGRGIPGVEIKKLELIIERCVKRYNTLVDERFENSGINLTDDQILVEEEAIISSCLEKYDNEACEFMGRKIKANWKEGGGDNLEVRKRILFRKLNEMKGRLMENVHQLRAKFDSFLLYIANFEKILTTKMPLTDEQMSHELSQFPVGLSEILKPYTFENMNILVNKQLQLRRDSMFEKIKKLNADLTLTAVDQFIQKSIHRSKIMVDLAVRRAVQSAIANIKKSAPSNVDINVLRSMENEITFKAAKCCLAFKNAKFGADLESEKLPVVQLSKDISPIQSPEDFHRKAIIAAKDLISATLQDTVESLMTELKDSASPVFPAIILEDLDRDLQYKIKLSSRAFLEAEYDLRNNA